MKKTPFFLIKQTLKQVLQIVVLPCVYRFWRIIYFRRPMEGIVLADAHHDALPYSMERIYHTLVSRGYTVTLAVCNYNNIQIQKIDKACL